MATVALPFVGASRPGENPSRARRDARRGKSSVTTLDASFRAPRASRAFRFSLQRLPAYGCVRCLSSFFVLASCADWCPGHDLWDAASTESGMVKICLAWLLAVRDDPLPGTVRDKYFWSSAYSGQVWRVPWGPFVSPRPQSQCCVSGTQIRFGRRRIRSLIFHVCTECKALPPPSKWLRWVPEDLTNCLETESSPKLDRFLRPKRGTPKCGPDT